MVKNITLSAEASLIEQARAEARARKTTLNQLFREWLVGIAGQQERQQTLESLLARLEYAQAGGSFTRQEMNER